MVSGRRLLFEDQGDADLGGLEDAVGPEREARSIAWSGAREGRVAEGEEFTKKLGEDVGESRELARR